MTIYCKVLYILRLLHRAELCTSVKHRPHQEGQNFDLDLESSDLASKSIYCILTTAMWSETKLEDTQVAWGKQVHGM